MTGGNKNIRKNIFDKRRNGRRTAVTAIEGLCTAAGVNPVTPPHFTPKYSCAWPPQLSKFGITVTQEPANHSVKEERVMTQVSAMEGWVKTCMNLIFNKMMIKYTPYPYHVTLRSAQHCQNSDPSIHKNLRWSSSASIIW